MARDAIARRVRPEAAPAGGCASGVTLRFMARGAVVRWGRPAGGRTYSTIFQIALVNAEIRYSIVSRPE
ncbi:MAG: hypothetical protein NZ553_16850 [Caldilinea sp.]|nr:hypothetical protein [Caldilinea sp.]MDW8442149.1 hypothetical protein [Caldilineaceae bacterium]